MSEDNKPKKVGKSSNKTSESDKKLERLELVVAKIAHYSGNERILDEFGIPRWTPGKKDMSKLG